MSYLRGTAVDRFFNKVKKEKKCWIWTGSTRGGYGCMWLSKEKGFKAAHRFSWEMIHGEIKKNLCVCHKCDNPKCVNPDHLFLGTHKDNMDDRGSKKRSRGGSNIGLSNPISKLDRDSVIEIRNSYIKGKPGNLGKLAGNAKRLSRIYGVSTDTIHKVAQLKRYTDIK